uniref:Aa_trans domain-containing protein n=1 Tax=Steinernema glaseri TaxID=37863 RepID=A0A1I7ZJR3_9BILA
MDPEVAMYLNPILGLTIFWPVLELFNRPLYSEQMCPRFADWRIQVTRYLVVRLAVLFAVFGFWYVQGAPEAQHDFHNLLKCRTLAATVSFAIPSASTTHYDQPFVIFCVKAVAAKLPRVERIIKLNRTPIKNVLTCAVYPKLSLKSESFGTLLLFSLLTLAYVLPGALVAFSITGTVFLEHGNQPLAALL